MLTLLIAVVALLLLSYIVIDEGPSFWEKNTAKKLVLIGCLLALYFVGVNDVHIAHVSINEVGAVALVGVVSLVVTAIVMIRG